MLMDSLSRSYLQKLLKESHVTVGGQPVKANYRIKTEDAVRVLLPPLITPDILPENIPLEVLYEDEDVIVAYSAALKTVDFIVEGIDRAKCAIIVTEWPHEICKALTETFGSGIPRVSAKGGYSNRDKAMLYFVVNRYQVIRMKDIVHDIDPAAFIIISEVADIFSSNNE